MNGFLVRAFGLFMVAVAPSHARSLEACIEEALAGNAHLEAMTHRVAAAEAAIGMARSAYYPTLYANAQYARTDNPPQAFFMNLNQRQASLQNDFNQPEDTDNLRGTLGFRMLVADAGARSLSGQSAELRAKAAEAARDAARNELVHLVTRAYYGVLQAKALLEVGEESVASLRENMRVAQERFEAGSVVKTDVLNLEVQVAEAQDQVIRARNGVQLALAALNTAIGRTFVDDAEQVDPVSSELDAPVDADAVFAGLDERPDLVAASLEAEAASREATGAQRDRWPKLVAFGSVDADSDRLGDFEESYLVGAMVDVEIFTGKRRSAEQAMARARSREATARKTALRQQVEYDHTQSWLSVQEAWSRLQVARQSQASADEALRITRERYEQGAADITQLLTAQLGLTSNRSREAGAMYDFLIAESNLRRARGLLVNPLVEP
ncbi:MAG TPA: TolC family protein [Kiritimatiellia bacterium]|nr:TolC family protein [Kiritimatiellia bacterium]HMP34275.1 TolC family protein [Kiritimatiellia bacterium]